MIEQYVPAPTQAATRRAVEEIQASGLLTQVVSVGAQITQFELSDQNGNSVSSHELLTRGGLVLTFFRGRWCPFCVAQLEAMSEIVGQVRALGAEFLAISPQTVHQSSLMRDQHGLNFLLLSDAGNAVARQFGLVYRVPDYQQAIYARAFTNLPFINGDASWELPVPATFVVGQDGGVRWAWVTADYTQRPEPAEIFKALNSIR